MNIVKKSLIALAAAVVFAAQAQAAPVRDDRAFDTVAVQKEVRKRLVMIPNLSVFDNLVFSVQGGTVTLYGDVVKPWTRRDAEKRVAKVAGVTRVVNNIHVLPLSSFDDSIRVRTYRSIFRTGGLYRYALGTNPSIRIIVDRGRVRLEGVVSSRGDAQLADFAARSVPGVFSVTNNLRIEREG
jgi:hyperosmotically inducible periplasmic protein